MNSTMTRLERLEAASPAVGTPPIFVSFYAPEDKNEGVAGCDSGALHLKRQQGETVDELKARAALIPPDDASCIRVWLVRS